MFYQYVQAALLAALASIVCSSSEPNLLDFSWEPLEDSTRRLAHDAGDGRQDHLPERVKVEFSTANAVKFQLQLRRQRELLHAKARHILQFRNGSTMEGPAPKPCSYIGEVLGSEGGSAMLSTCNNRMSGLVLADGQALRFEVTGSVASSGLHTRQSHKGAVRVTELHDEEFLRQHKRVRDFIRRPPANATKDHHRRLTSSGGKKYVEVLAVNDYRRFQDFGGISATQEMAQHTAEVLAMVNTIYHTPITGGTFPHEIVVVLVGQHTFVEEDPWESTVATDGSETDMNDLLAKLHTWGLQQQSAGNIVGHDNRVLLSGRDFLGSVAGLAGVGTMCLSSDSGSVNECLSGDAAQPFCAGVISHEMGHNFGMSHDSSNNACAQSGNIMEAVGTGTASDTFSSCSASYMSTFFSSRYDSNGNCLENPPTVVAGDPQCGNGFVECGDDPDNCAEQCDCGLDDCSSSDPCCDGATCTFLQADYECSDFLGECCSSCKFVTADANFACREARNECDLPETCPGGTGACPLDRFVYPGSVCSIVDGSTTYDGLCFAGQCHSQDYKCAVELTEEFDGTFDMSEPCAAYNDDCNLMVCHDAADSDPNACVQEFQVHGSLMKVPDGTPCWFKNDARGARQGMCSGGQCLNPDLLAVVPLCGNGGIDYGEQCDCGASADPCCDCDTCALVAGAACSSLEPCCTQTCEFEPAGTVCRAAAHSDCDIAEECPGDSARCPPDEGHRWGTVCDDGGVGSTCYGKACLPNLNTQCAALDEASPFAKGELATGNLSMGGTDSGTAHTCTAIVCCETCEVLEGTYNINNAPVTDPYYCQSCGWSTSFTEWTFGDPPETVRIYTSGASEGAVLGDQSKMCLSSEATTPQAAADCADAEFFERSVGVCLPCNPGCSACTGPSAYDCVGDCTYGSDSLGRCALSEDQAQLAADLTTAGTTQGTTQTATTTTTTPTATTVASTTTTTTTTTTTVSATATTVTQTTTTGTQTATTTTTTQTATTVATVSATTTTVTQTATTTTTPTTTATTLTGTGTPTTTTPTATTSTTTTPTTTTTTTPPKVAGEMTCAFAAAVAQAFVDDFNSDPSPSGTIYVILRASIASAIDGVASGQVRIVAVRVIVLRRLKLGRSLTQASSSVAVDYEIDVPSDLNPTQVASTLEDANSATAISDALGTELSAASLTDYQVTGIEVTADVVTTTTTTSLATASLTTSGGTSGRAGQTSRALGQHRCVSKVLLAVAPVWVLLQRR
mmetsp:Transcript_12568/g.28401  ORF Transcript_12568/g.28401 Transcript_12568/m.28401 type:complete len:1248 (-) Transcript_12568:71-3814(-)